MLKTDKTILQYEISDWSQLAKCQSNNSPELKIVVSKYLQNFDIEGTKIEITHPKYGTLFAYTILPKGDLITDINCCCQDVMTHTTLLNEIQRYGFYVDYVAEAHLSAGLVNLLKTIQGLHFDKIRLFAVHENSDPTNSTLYITAFNIQTNEQWLNSGYSPSRKEWEEAILNGTAMNVSGLNEARKYNWSWIYNAVYDIDQILSRYDDDAE